jgi:hypothetical protein
MKLENILIGGVIGGVIAYLILKPKTSTTANASGSSTKRDEQLSQHFSEELKHAQAKFVDFNSESDNFSKDPNAPQSQPYLATVSYGSPNITGVPIHAGFSYPDKELYQTSPFKF